jgi:6-pyruvoyltetrahydropterin/6-carboxytetrahydropterin synthase
MPLEALMVWTARVEEEFSAAHHNGPDGHKCNRNHGHDWLAVVEVTYRRIDEHTGWGPDFGAIKALIKPLDHNDLNEYFDFPPSAENLARWLYEEVKKLLGPSARYRGVVDFIEIHEGGGNVVTYREDDGR